MDKLILDNLDKISKPARYAGGEYNSIIKTQYKLNYCMCFPDVYEVAMSNLGTQILYYLLNQRTEFYAQRCYAVWPDMGEVLKQNNAPLFSLETKTPLKEFDFLGFSFQSELGFTNLLYMLDLAHIPLKRSQRDDSFPIIMAGGPCMVNPLPIMDFVDVVVIGDGEETLNKICDTYLKCNKNRTQFFKAIKNIDGVFIPDVHDITKPSAVKKAVIKDLNNTFCLDRAIVPNIEAVHNRAVLELFRGCPRGCRFCQAGFIYRPTRYRTKDNLLTYARALIENSGLEELSLNSLSTGDYPELGGLIADLKPIIDKYSVNLALPSLRLDSFEGGFTLENRKSSLTFAPEAGTQRLRDVINKNITDEDFEKAMSATFKNGYSKVKLYFMIGLPTETQDDIDGIIQMVQKVKRVYSLNKTSKQPLAVTVSTSVFIPKPFTPFQWEGLDDRQVVEEKQQYLSLSLRKMGVKYIYHDMSTTIIESVLTRGDRRINDVILNAYNNGCIFDGWSEYFSFDKWLQAFSTANVDINDYTNKFNTEKFLPWEFIDIGVTKQFLLNEKMLSYNSKTTKACFSNCSNCGITKLTGCVYVGV